jgi:hypothetical protein
MTKIKEAETANVIKTITTVTTPSNDK